MLIHSGRSSLADDILNDLGKTDPDNPTIIFLAARIKFEKSEFAAADSLLSHDFISDNADRSVFFLKGNIKMSLVQYDSVVHYSDLLLTKGPDKEAYQMRGKALDKRYRYQLALNSYNQALSLDSTDLTTLKEIEILHRKIAYVNRIKQAKLDSANRPVIQPLKSPSDRK